MSRANKGLVILMIATLGLWGCAKGTGPEPTAAEQIKALEAKVSRIEEDLRAAAQARDTVRKKLTALEEQYAQSQKERDDDQSVELWTRGRRGPSRFTNASEA